MGTPNVPTPSWTPSNTGYADSTYAGALGGLSTLSGLGYGAANNIANNPYSAAAMQGAQTTGNYMTGTLAPNYQNASSNLFGMVNSGLPYAQSILQTGFDPQNQLYSQQRQQNQDQTLALEAAQGVSQTPYGASVAAQNNQNFNLNWDNQRLGREATALGAYGGFMGQAGQGYQTAGNLGRLGADTYNTGASLPYSTYLGQQMNALGGYNQAANLGQATTGAAGNYLGLADQNYGNQIDAYKAQAQAAGGLRSGIGGLLGFGADSLGLSGGGLGSLLGIGGGGGGGAMDFGSSLLSSVGGPSLSMLPFAFA